MADMQDETTGSTRYPPSGQSGDEAATGGASGSPVRDVVGNLESPTAGAEQAGETKPPEARRPSGGGLPAHLLDRLITLVEERPDSNEPDQADLQQDEIYEVIASLWESTHQATELHGELLSLIEKAITSLASLDDSRRKTIREAAIDLKQPRLVRSQIDFTTSQMIDDGVGALGVFDESQLNGGE